MDNSIVKKTGENKKIMKQKLHLLLVLKLFK